MRGTQVTIKDIARELGISPSTVSRALKDHPDISARTKRKVNELAQKYAYKPNAVALSLLQSKTNVIGVVIPEMVHFFFSSVISGIEEVAFKAGYQVMVCQSNESYTREIDSVNALVASRVDGLLISISKETEDYAHLVDLDKRGIPIVFFDRVCDEIQTHKVIIDDEEGAFKATEHLLQQGRRKVAHLAGPLNLLIGQNRLKGYKSALAKYGVPFDDRLVIQCDTFEKAIKDTPGLLQDYPDLDAVFAVNDETAAGCLREVKRAGYRVPADISIIGFTNGRISSITDPQLSTVDQHGFEMGQEACRLLLKRFTTKFEDYLPETSIIPSSLVVRESSEK